MAGMTSIAPRRIALDPALSRARVGASKSDVGFNMLVTGALGGLVVTFWGYPVWGAVIFFGSQIATQLWLKLA